MAIERRADVEMFWTKSAGLDIDHVVIKVTINGEQVLENTLQPTVESALVEVAAFGTVQFQIDTYDTEGLVTTAISQAFNVGDLTAPPPATDLGFRIVAIRDVEVPDPE